MTDSDTVEADRQLPRGDEIFLDHVGHFVADVEAAGRALARAGFAPTPVSVQVNPDPVDGTPRIKGRSSVNRNRPSTEDRPSTERRTDLGEQAVVGVGDSLAP